MLKLLLYFTLLFFAFSQQEQHFTDKLLLKPVHISREMSRFKQFPETVDTEKNFYVRNVLNQEHWDETPFKLVEQTRHANIWMETTLADSIQSHIFTQLPTIKTFLEEKTSAMSMDSTQGMFALSKTYFGDAPNVDEDGRLDILYLDVRDNFKFDGSYIAGFFDPNDLSTEEFSNRRDIIYIDVYPGIVYEGSVRDINQSLATLAHEYQHLIHANYRTGEMNGLVFLNEGLSEFSEIVHGFTPRGTSQYLSNLNVDFFSWFNANVIADYERASLFTHFLFETLGYNNAKLLVQDPKSGVEPYSELLKTYGYTLSEFIQKFHLQNVFSPENYKHPDRQNLRVTDIKQAYSKPFLDTDSLEKFGIKIYETDQEFEHMNSSALVSILHPPYQVFFNTSPSENVLLTTFLNEVDSNTTVPLKLDDGSPDIITGSTLFLKAGGVGTGFGLPLYSPYQGKLRSVSVFGLFKSELTINDSTLLIPRQQRLTISKHNYENVIYEEIIELNDKHGALGFREILLSKEININANDSLWLTLSNTGSNLFYMAMDANETKSFITDAKGDRSPFKNESYKGIPLQGFNVMLRANLEVEKELSALRSYTYHHTDSTFVLYFSETLTECQISYFSPGNSRQWNESNVDSIVLPFAINKTNQIVVQSNKNETSTSLLKLSFASYFPEKRHGTYRDKHWEVSSEHPFQIVSHQNEKVIDVQTTETSYFIRPKQLKRMEVFHENEWIIAETFQQGSHKFRIVDDTNSTLFGTNYHVDTDMIYPNPNRGEFNIPLFLSHESDVLVNIYNVIGQNLFSETYFAEKGKQVIPVEMKTLNISSGVYFLTVQSKSKYIDTNKAWFTSFKMVLIK